MPANRAQLARDDKVEQLVATAQHLFVERGYEGTTMAAIAKQAGVASNVLYWYFDSKDHVFVVAMEQLVDAVIDQALAAATRRDGTRDIEAGLVALVDHLMFGRTLIAAVHERAPHAPIVAEFHDRVHARYASLLDDELRARAMPPAERRLVIEALSTGVEGLIVHGATKPEARRMIHFLVTKLL